MFTAVSSSDFLIDHNFAILYDPPQDGACQFAAVSHQLEKHEITSIAAHVVRESAINYLKLNPDCFTSFISSKSWEQYLRDMSARKTHGDHITLFALSRQYNVQFLIISSLGVSSTVLINPLTTETHGNYIVNPSLPLLLLGHSAEQHGEHYYSISPTSDETLQLLLSQARLSQSQTTLLQEPALYDINPTTNSQAVDTDDTTPAPNLMPEDAAYDEYIESDNEPDLMPEADDDYDDSSESDNDLSQSQNHKKPKRDRACGVVVAPFARCESKGGFIHVFCTVCCEQKNVVSQLCSKRFPPIATSEGARLRARDMNYHLTTDYHTAAVKASEIKRMPFATKQTQVPMHKFLFKAQKAEAKSVGGKLVDVYCDAKKALSAYSWPARYVANAIAKQFDPNVDHMDYDPSPSTLTYVNPTTHRELLHAIVDTERPRLRMKIENSLAASIRVDGSVDRRQEDNKHVMLKIVAENGEENTFFLGKYSNIINNNNKNNNNNRLYYTFLAFHSSCESLHLY